jgi:hypothetical protein
MITLELVPADFKLLHGWWPRFNFWLYINVPVYIVLKYSCFCSWCLLMIEILVLHVLSEFSTSPDKVIRMNRMFWSVLLKLSWLAWHSWRSTAKYHACSFLSGSRLHILDCGSITGKGLYDIIGWIWRRLPNNWPPAMEIIVFFGCFLKPWEVEIDPFEIKQQVSFCNIDLSYI